MEIAQNPQRAVKFNRGGRSSTQVKHSKEPGRKGEVHILRITKKGSRPQAHLYCGIRSETARKAAPIGGEGGGAPENLGRV